MNVVFIKKNQNMNKKNNTIREKILKGMEIANMNLIKDKIKKNSMVVISCNGRIIKFKPINYLV
jgi:hypothetical protein